MPPRSPSRRVTSVASFLAVALLLAGCSAAPGPPPATAPMTGAGSTATSAPADPEASEADDLHGLGWRGVQAPTASTVTLVDTAPATPSPADPVGPFLEVSLQPGTAPDDPYAGRRAEVYGRVAPSWSDQAAAWPDPPGSERWYTFSLLVPTGFTFATDDAQWLDLTQWKGRDGGSPPQAVEVTGDRLRLGGTRGNAGIFPDGGDLGPLIPGTWTTLTVGIRWSTDAADGWVEVLRDGVEVLPRTPAATMDVIDGAPDPVYLKQGIYRSATWTVAQTAYFSRVEVSKVQPSA